MPAEHRVRGDLLELVTGGKTIAGGRLEPPVIALETHAQEIAAKIRDFLGDRCRG